LPSLLLLVSHRLARAFAGTSVSLRTLTSYGQTLSVANTAIAADFDKSLDVESDITTEITFNAAIMVDIFSEF